MKKTPFFLIILVLTLFSCSDYQKLLKSDDAELKYTKAVEYFNKGDFMRASTLFDAVANYYKGTDRSETVLNYMARSYMGQKDYFSASEYYKTYVKTYPKGKYVIESKFMIGYCFYLDSPDPRLDQTSTYSAIAAFQEFLDDYPESDKVPQANKLLDEMTNKLAYKAYLNAKLYYNLGNYLGNNYLSAVITAENALKKFPATIYREDLLMLILNSKYDQAIQSVDEKKVERYRNTLDEYYNYINEFPNGKYRKQADKIMNESKKIVKE
jgi:outer membrane protein assembly factor BamD